LGGVARRATKISQERKKGGAILLLDAGDSLVGDQDPARKTQGQTSVAAMNMLGYDAMVLGPQDLALGPAVLRQRIAEARFAILSANAVVSATGELMVTPFVIRELSGNKVALVGISGGGTNELVVRNPLQTAQSVVAQVKSQADVIILISHAGASVDRQIADAVPGIALIVSGGPRALPAPWRSDKTGTLVLHADEAQSGHAGRVMGVAALAFDSRGQLVQQDWQSVALADSIPDDPAMSAWVRQQSR
jgi:2',3'-cyclic-nucleotide 2'-phosphodiesterase (5'-nucleotidase family)